MGKLLEKAIKDAVENDKYAFGNKEVLKSMKSSKLVVLSRSVSPYISEKIIDSAKNSKVPILNYGGTSVDLGKLCGTQFRISTISLKTLNESNLKAIINDEESNQE